jgi:hypothetical protein
LAALAQMTERTPLMLVFSTEREQGARVSSSMRLL